MIGTDVAVPRRVDAAVPRRALSAGFGQADSDGSRLIRPIIMAVRGVATNDERTADRFTPDTIP